MHSQVLGGTIMPVATVQPTIPLSSFLLAGRPVWKIMPSVLEMFLIYLFIFNEFLSCISHFLELLMFEYWTSSVFFFFSMFFCILTHFICFNLCALLPRRSFSHIYFCNHIFFISKSSFLFCECSIFAVLYFFSMKAISSHVSENIDICLTCIFFS